MARADAEGVDDIDDVLVREELAELLALLRGDELLEDLADDVVRDLRKSYCDKVDQ